MDNNNVDEIPGIRADEGTAILDAIENDVSARTIDKTVDM